MVIYQKYLLLLPNIIYIICVNIKHVHHYSEKGFAYFAIINNNGFMVVVHNVIIMSFYRT